MFFFFPNSFSAPGSFCAHLHRCAHKEYSFLFSPNRSKQERKGSRKKSFFAACPKRPSREKKGKKGGHRRFNGNVIIYRVLSEYKVYLLTLLAIKSLVRKDKYIRYTYV